MNTDRRPSSARAVLGAMSWRIPDDDWSSPWSFEEEWIWPQPGDKKDLLSPGAEEGEGGTQQHNMGPPPVGMPQITPRGMMLQFEDPEPEEVVPPATLPVIPRKVARAASAAASTVVPPRKPQVEEPRRAPVPHEERQELPKKRKPQPLHDDEATLNKVPLTPEDLPDPGYKLEPLPPSKWEEADQKPMTRIPRKSSGFSWGTLISLGLGTLGFTLLAWIYLHDTPRDSDEDLRPQRVVDQTPTTLATVKLKAFLDSIKPAASAELRSKPPWLWDTPSLATFIRLNGTALDNLRDLLEDYDWHPHHANWHQEDFSSHAAWGHASTLLQGQAAYLARRGDEEPAFIAAIDLAEMSRRLQEVWAWPGYMNRALELEQASVQILAELLKTTRLDSRTLGRFQDEFTRCQPDTELMRQACAAYYLHEKKLLLGPASGELLDTLPGGRLHRRPARLFFKTNETLSLFASTFRDLRDELTRPPYTRLSVSAAPLSYTRLTSPRFYHPNVSGEIYFSERIQPQLDLPQGHSLAQARHALVRCLFGIRRYLAETRKLPKQLSDLTPKFLSSVPQDPFSGETLHYDTARGLLYSVGINLIAEGGKPSAMALDDDREPTVELGISMTLPVK